MNGKNSARELKHSKRNCEAQNFGGGNDMSEVDGVRVVVMEVDGDLKQMTKMLKELTLDQSNQPLQFLVAVREVAN